MNDSDRHAISDSESQSYRLISTLGQGGFGTVYRAELTGSSGFRKIVAIKLLNEDNSRHEVFRARLRDEARLLALLHHRAIVQVDNLLQLDGRWAVVMEYVEGADLKGLLEQGPIPSRPLCEIAGEVASALQKAYESQDPHTGQPLHIVHRDIKPANIRITPSGEVKVLDFGVARAAFVGRESHTQSMALGSLGYFSPERFDGIDTPAADIYALGIVVLEALLGRTAGQFSVHHRVHQRKLARLLDEMDQSLPAPFSVRLKPLLASMMAYEWQQRPSAAQVTDAFQDLLLVADGPWLKRWAAGAIEQVEPTPPPDLKPSHEETLPLVAPAATPQGFGIHPRARRLFLLAAAILATVLALASVFAGGAWLWWRASPVVSTRGNHATNIQDHLPAPEAAAILPAESPVASQERVTGSIPEQKPAKNPKASATPPTTNKPRPPVQAPPKARDMVSSPIQESPPTGQVVFKGAVESVRLRDANGKEYAPGQVPVGTYDLLVVFNGGASISLDELVKVKHGETTVVRCDAVAENCR